MKNSNETFESLYNSLNEENKLIIAAKLLSMVEENRKNKDIVKKRKKSLYAKQRGETFI